MTRLDDALGNFRAELMQQAEAIADGAYNESGELDETTIPVMAFAIGIILGRVKNTDEFKKEGLDIVMKMIATAIWKDKPDDFTIPN
jgi:hypothetical protein